MDVCRAGTVPGAEDFCDFMAGDTAKFERRLTKRMQEAAAEMEYEQAARLRDDIQALRRATEKNAVVLGDATDADALAIVGLGECLKQKLAAAARGFRVPEQRIEFQALNALAVVARLGLRDHLAHGDHIAQAVDHPGFRGQAIAARRSGRY